MPKGLDYIINLKDGDFGGAKKAKSEIGGLDDAVHHANEGFLGLGETFGKVGELMAEAFAIEKIIDFGKESLQIYRSTESAAAQIAQGIKTTSGVAGRSLAEFREQAEMLEHKTLFTEAQTEQAQAIELTFTNIRGKIMDETIPAIQDLATRMGGDGPADLKGAALQLGKALQDPMTGIAALHRVGVSFSDAQKEMIAQDVKHGEVQKAQSIILKELNTEFGGSAAAARAVLGSSAELNTEIEELKKGFGHLITEGLAVVVPMILDLGHEIKDLAGDLKEAYQWVKTNADIFKALGIAVGISAAAYAILNPNIVLGTVATAAQTVVMQGAAAITSVLTAAQWALNVAMDANPVGIIIVGLGALVGGLYLAYQRSETFRAVLSGIGEVAHELVPIFKGLGEIILGAVTLNPTMVVDGFKDAYNGIKKVIDDGGIGGAFSRGFDESLAASKHDAEARAQKEKDDKHTESATSLFGKPEPKNTPFSISTGKHKKAGGDDTASVSGGTSVRNVRVTIGKLVETIVVKNTTIGNLKNGDLKRQITELLTGAVHDSELALGSQ